MLGGSEGVLEGEHEGGRLCLERDLYRAKNRGRVREEEDRDRVRRGGRVCEEGNMR